RYGVPAASPPALGTVSIARTGHAGAHAPQRVHAVRNANSGSAPGGRTYRCWTNLRSVSSTRRSSHSPKTDRNRSRRSVSPGIIERVYPEGVGKDKPDGRI